MALLVPVQYLLTLLNNLNIFLLPLLPDMYVFRGYRIFFPSAVYKIVLVVCFFFLKEKFQLQPYTELKTSGIAQ